MTSHTTITPDKVSVFQLQNGRVSIVFANYSPTYAEVGFTVGGLSQAANLLGSALEKVEDLIAKEEMESEAVLDVAA